jgi:hypothetical protein
LLSQDGKVNYSCQQNNQAGQNVSFIFHLISKLIQRNYFDIFQRGEFGL